MKLCIIIHARSAYYGEGFGDIHLDDVECSGTENRLVDCNHKKTPQLCSHREDISIECISEWMMNN